MVYDDVFGTTYVAGRNRGFPPRPEDVSAVERYSGHGSAHAWLANFEQWSHICAWDPDTQLRVASVRMTGVAQRWMHTRKFSNWDEFRVRFLDRFCLTQEAALAELFACQQQPQESPAEYADPFRMYAHEASLTENSSLVHRFICGLHPELRDEVMRKELCTIDDVMRFCEYWLSCSYEHGYGWYSDGDSRRSDISSNYLPDYKEAVWLSHGDSSDYSDDATSDQYDYDYHYDAGHFKYMPYDEPTVPMETISTAWPVHEGHVQHTSTGFALPVHWSAEHERALIEQLMMKSDRLQQQLEHLMIMSERPQQQLEMQKQNHLQQLEEEALRLLLLQELSNQKQQPIVEPEEYADSPSLNVSKMEQLQLLDGPHYPTSAPAPSSKSPPTSVVTQRKWTDAGEDHAEVEKEARYGTDLNDSSDASMEDVPGYELLRDSGGLLLAGESTKLLPEDYALHHISDYQPPCSAAALKPKESLIITVAVLQSKQAVLAPHSVEPSARPTAVRKVWDPGKHMLILPPDTVQRHSVVRGESEGYLANCMVHPIA